MANENDEPVEMTDDPTQQTPPARKPAVRREEIPDDPEATRAELERTRAALKKANAEAAERRRRLEELEAAEEERAKANLSEAERQKRDRAEADRRAAEAEREAADARKALAEERIDMVVERRAAAKGFLYPDTAPRLIDRSRVTIDEDTGRPDPKSIDDALERLLKDKPGLAEASPRGGTPPRDGPRRLNGGTRGGQRDPREELEADLRATRNYTS